MGTNARTPWALCITLVLLFSANAGSSQEFATDPFGASAQLGGDATATSVDSSNSLGGGLGGLLGGGGGGGGSGGFGGLGGGGGCSSNYWAQHPNSWPNLLTIYTTVTQVLGQVAYTIFGGPTTLLGALQNQSTDAYSSLLREATAALLNSYSRPGFQYSPSAIRTAFQSSLHSQRSAAYQAALFRHANSGYGADSSCS
ncbi:putative lysozyme-like protein [Selaginella moellendorffii]|uniref:putative lysozyme-like protein n=1 Tax=Selaginella moellendorffii TaxID=88036 RepID=UPI000D1C8F30|nr:putative lysozyme-like protein [Selaginella moellendorffii]XP_024544561.1 putative lysozyme-like protein [Selaginella moellendorffii]|eukprot:XP_024520123.1 putative lysozyme-like protein [Selaginella moellendorffii]